MKKVVVYTAVTRGFETIRDPEVMSKEIDYICYSDNPRIVRGTVWQYREISDIGLDPVRVTKHIKIMPHLYFPEYERSIWVDGRVLVRGDISSLLDRCLAEKGCAFAMHPWRNSIYDEAQACIQKGKDSVRVIESQMARYRAEGYPEENGLISGGVILRNHHDAQVQQVMEAWWEEVFNGSLRDQLSFNYVAWKNNFNYALIPGDIWENEWFAVVPRRKTIAYYRQRIRARLNQLLNRNASVEGR